MRNIVVFVGTEDAKSGRITKMFKYRLGNIGSTNERIAEAIGRC